MSYVYFGQVDGPRILRYGEGHQLVQGDGTLADYTARLELWALEPMGPVGDIVFRSIDLKLRHTLGYSVTVTPVVDGVADTPQTFSGGPAPGGEQEEYVELQAPITRRGSQVSAIVELDASYTVQDIVTISASGMPLRQVP